MLSQDEIFAVYEAGPDALVAWVGQLTAAYERQMADLAAQIEQLLAAQATLGQQVSHLTAQVTELEARLNKDSHNSHSTVVF